MKRDSYLDNIILKTKPGKFLKKKCSESDAWARGVTAVGIGIVILICLI